MYKIAVLLFLLLNLGCQYFDKQPDDTIIAKAGKHTLYKVDLTFLNTEGLSTEDSLQLVTTYINKWATQKLLMDQAIRNLSKEKINSYNELIENYKTDLYTKGYLDILATQALNTNIKEQEYDYFYNQNKDNFLLNEELIKLRYVHIGTDNSSRAKLKQQLERFNETDQKELEEKAIQYKSFSLNDSVWVQANLVKDLISAVNNDNYNQLLKKSNNLELQDSLGVYLIFVKEVLKRNEQAPLEYVKQTIEQIILNRRKLEIIKNLEKDLLKDAIKSKKFEIYN